MANFEYGYYTRKKRIPLVSGILRPSITITANSIMESALVGSTIGTLSVVGGTGTYTFTKINDPDSKFSLSGNNLILANSLNYETASIHLVAISATNGVNTPVIQTFSVLVGNVFEGPTLTPLILPSEVSEGTTIPIYGATPGSTITGTLPTGWSLNSAARTVTVGLVASNQSWSLTEALTDSINTNRVSTGTVNIVADAGAILYRNTDGTTIVYTLGTPWTLGATRLESGLVSVTGTGKFRYSNNDGTTWTEGTAPTSIDEPLDIILESIGSGSTAGG